MKKKQVGEYVKLSLSKKYKNLDYFIQDLKEEYEKKIKQYKNITIKTYNTWWGGIGIDVYGYRTETDEEFQKRIQSEEFDNECKMRREQEELERQKNQEQEEKELLKQLKEKYEKTDS